MAFPRSSRRSEPEAARIDARMPDAKEAGLRNVHRGMDGKPIGGTDETGKRVAFSPPSGLDALNKPGLQTGNARVSFKSAAERGAEMNAANNQRLATVDAGVKAAGAKAAMAKKFPQPQIIKQSDGSTGGLITGRETGGARLSSVYGTGTATLPGATTLASESGKGRFPKPAAKPFSGSRIADETGDRTKDFQAGGRFSSQPAPKAVAVAKSTMPRHSALLPSAVVRPQAEADAIAAKATPAPRTPLAPASLNPTATNAATAIPSGMPKPAAAPTPTAAATPAAANYSSGQPKLVDGVKVPEFGSAKLPRPRPSMASR